MSVVVPHRAIELVATSNDPKKTILETVGNLDGIDVTGDMVLIGTYIRPQKTAGGIWRPDANVQEDVWQGKVGLVLKWGTTAFQDTSDYAFEANDRISLGQWCVFKVGDAWQLIINGYPCRLVRDVNIRMRVNDPKAVI